MRKLVLTTSILAAAILVSVLLSGCTDNSSTTGDALYSCNADSDCVPKPECHPLECINQEYADDSLKPKACTAVFIAEAAYVKEDCACQNGLCINKNRQPYATNSTGEAESLAYARSFVIDSSTYKYDGSGIRHTKTTVLRCPFCWTFTFTFTSNRAGYGDRTGQMVAEVITPHEAVVTVTNGRIASGIIDGVWDMMKDELIPGADHPEIPLELYCELDEECACGINKDTKDCFFGNIEYVDEGVQCPDFCTGIAGNLAVRCIDNQCQQIRLT